MSPPEKAERITITIPPDMLVMIKNKVQSGAYGSTSEVIREAMRLWKNKEDKNQVRLAVIRKRLAASLKSGEPVSLENAFNIIERIHQKRTEAELNENV